MNVQNIQTFIDSKGIEVALVPLKGKHAKDTPYAQIDMEDLQALAERGIGLNWCMNHNGNGLLYVSGSNPEMASPRVNIAREIMQPRVGQVVTYRSTDRSNLRRSNLLLTDGPQRARTLKQIPELEAVSSSACPNMKSA